MRFQVRDLSAWLVAFIRAPGRTVEFLRYATVSGLSLALDIAAFFALTSGTFMSAALAGAVSCMIGLVLHYVLSVIFVFDAKATGKTQKRLMAEYGLTGAMGFGITLTSIFVTTDVVGAHAVIGKVVGVGLTFVTVYIVRSGIVFARAAPHDAVPSR